MSDGNGKVIKLNSNTKEYNIGATFVHEATHSILGPVVKDPEKNQARMEQNILKR